jgi:protein involved in polysaccharide export with SLBB domain
MLMPFSRVHFRRGLVATLLLAGCRSAPPATVPVPQTMLRSWTTQPGDQVRVRVWREPELSGEVSVQADGSAIFPALGRLVVGGLTADSLNALLIARFRERIVETPVDATLIRPLPVLGAIRVPGVYQVEPTATAIQVIARAGGTLGSEEIPRIQLLRQDGARYDLSPEQSLGGFDIRNGDALFVQDRSWFVRNQRRISVISSVASIIVSIVTVIIVTTN